MHSNVALHRLFRAAATVVISVTVLATCAVNGNTVLMVTPADAELEVGEMLSLIVNPRDPADAFSFSSSDPVVASVGPGGTITAHAPGSATITVSGSSSGATGTSSISVVTSSVDESNGPGMTSSRSVTSGGVPYVELTLDDGRTVRLDDPTLAQRAADRAPDLASLEARLPSTRAIIRAPSIGGTGRSFLTTSPSRAVTRPTADRISLTSDQTDIRDQGGRGLCVSHAVLAAIEAEYKRLGYGDLDLSEQHVQHMSKMSSLVDWGNKTPPAAEDFENQLAMGGGNNTYGLLSRLMIYGIPTEFAQPYISSGDYENYTQSGDSPTLVWNDWDTGTYAQSLVNSYNTEHEQVTIQIPYDFRVRPLPLTALENARYGITGYVNVPGGELQNPAWYERRIADGVEVIVGMNWIVDRDDETNILHARDKDDDETDGWHAVTIVGYDRTDANDPYFIVKNSWGPAGSRSFTKLSYDFLNSSLDGKITQASYITGVRDPDKTDFHPQLAVGRWTIAYDGLIGRLDIHRQSRFYDPGDLGGEDDYRLGIFYDASDTAYRVNGTISNDGAITFYINSTNRNAPYGDRSGLPFKGFVDPRDPRLMTGTFIDAFGNVQPFYAVQESFKSGTTTASGVSQQAFYGRWEFDAPVAEGHHVDVLSVDAVNDVFSGRYYHDSGWIAINGTANDTTGEFSFAMPGVSDVSGLFEGYLHNAFPAYASGSLVSGTETSMALVRTGPATENLEIVSPTQGETFSASDAKGVDVYLDAEVTQDGQPIPGTPLVIWTTDAPYNEPGAHIRSQGSTDGTAKFTAGTHTIYAYYTEDLIESITISVNVTDGPDITLNDVADGDYIYDASNPPFVDVFISGYGDDLQDGTIAISGWSYRQVGSSSWTNAGFGNSTTLELRDENCGPTQYEIRAEATDSDGNTSAEIITISVDSFGC